MGSGGSTQLGAGSPEHGELVISGVAERLAGEPAAIPALVFLDAFVPADGESLADLASPAVRDAIARLAAQGAPAMPPLPPPPSR